MVNKKLDLYAVSDKKLSDAFDRVVVKIYLQKEKKGSKSFMFCGADPRTGATTMAINIAIDLANAGWKTLFLDSDMRKNVMLKKINDDVETGLADYLSGEMEVEEVMYKTNHQNLFCIPCGKNISSPVQMMCSEKMVYALDNLKKNFDFVIVDVPSLGSAVDASSIASHVDETIMVVAQSRTQKTRIRKCKEELEDAGANIFGVVVNRVDEVEYKEYMKNYDYFTKGKYVVRAQQKKKENSEK
jgi:capsular exopolysaccharide synthesis family protein